MSGANFMMAALVAGDVMERIAGIETRRQAMEKISGRAAACSSALRELHELLEFEKEASQARGADAGSPERVESVKVEIGRVERLTLITSPGPFHKNAYPAGPRQASQRKSWQDAQRNPPRNKGRRTMGRAGER